VETTRERCGRAIARNDHVEADFVTGIPDSGVGHAIGYAIESGIPYRRPLVKYTPGYGRSYTPPSQDIRDLVATMKLSAIRGVINNSRMIVCDDSIVRGTQLKNFTVKKLIENGAREIHVRPACPPLMFPCSFASSTRSKSELASRRAIRAIEGADIENIDEYLDHRSDKYNEMVEWIRRDLNVTSLKYLNIEDMIKAIGLTEDQLCLCCWRGR
jgi:amidophosphoribosyltransferase